MSFLTHCLTLLAGTVLKWLRKATSGDELEEGLLSRIWLIRDVCDRPAMPWPEGSPDDVNPLTKQLEVYLEEHIRPRTGNPIPMYTLPFEDDGTEMSKLWDDWYDKNHKAGLKIPHWHRGWYHRREQVVLQTMVIMSVSQCVKKDIPPLFVEAHILCRNVSGE